MVLRTADSKAARQRRKAMGAHYTPSALADFVAQRLARRLDLPFDRPLRILDPACGDGVLLEALLRSLRAAGWRELEVHGVEADREAIRAAHSRLDPLKLARLRLTEGDFLARSSETTDAFDVVIANPPYVRTQVLGAERAQRLSARFNLTGRVDLYHAFLIAATTALRPRGLLGIITSNRFLSTRGGAAVRRYLMEQYDVDEIIDLGDTKLFSAAVLPALFFGRRRADGAMGGSNQWTSFTRVYSEPAARLNEESVAARDGVEVLSMLSQIPNGTFRAQSGVFRVSSGKLVLDRDPNPVWSLTTERETSWLKRLRAAARGTFADVATVRVGIKTTADDVFLRTDWETLPAACRPEAALMRPLLGHENARRWAPDRAASRSRRVLYTHETIDGRRQAIDFEKFPAARAYLEAHRARLERRSYVIAAGRRWYEIWVPQDPAAWSQPKLVFPDISARARFFFDPGGCVVNGDCYWMTPRSTTDTDVLYLLLGVANSDLLARYHDLAFNNRLYSERRRFITQYVEKYPYPDPESGPARKLIACVRRLVELVRADVDVKRIVEEERESNALVEAAFCVHPVESIA